MIEKFDRLPKTRPQEAVQIPSADEMRTELLHDGIAYEIETEKGKRMVVKLTQLKELLSKKYGNNGGRNERLTKQLLSGFVLMFPRGVLSDEQLLRKDLTPIPIFYSPKNSEDATSLNTIKSARFHLRFGDVLARYRMRTQLPGESDDSTNVSCLESEAGLVIFHPKYGNGYRDERGVLQVFDASSQSFKALSATFLTEHGVNRNYFIIPEGVNTFSARSDVRTSVREGVEVELPHLVQKKILQPDRDFAQSSLGNERVNARSIVRTGVSQSGSRMLNGVLHYIGKEFYGKPIKIVEVSPQLGCLVDESAEPRVTHLFKILSRNDVEPKKSGWYLAGKDSTKVRPFSSDVFGLSKMPSETLLQFQERKEAVDRGIAFLLLSLMKEYPVISELFTPDRKQVLGEVASVAYWLSKTDRQDDLRNLIDDYGVSGLRTFLATAIDPQVQGEVFTLVSSAKKPEAQERVAMLFQAFGGFVDTIEVMESYIRENLGITGPDDIPVFTESFLKRGRELLGQAHKFKEEPEKLAMLLERYSAEGQLLLSSYQLLKGQKKIRTLTEVGGVRREGISLADSKETGELEQCVTLYAQNGGEPGVIEDFRKKATESTSVLHRVMFNKTLVAFILVSRKDDTTVEMSALNARNELPGTNVGMNLFTEVLAGELGTGKSVEFEALPERFREYEVVLPRKMSATPLRVMKVGEYIDPKDEKLTFKGKITLAPRK